jgi:hypothetical protein
VAKINIRFSCSKASTLNAKKKPPNGNRTQIDYGVKSIHPHKLAPLLIYINSSPKKRSDATIRPFYIKCHCFQTSTKASSSIFFLKTICPSKTSSTTGSDLSIFPERIYFESSFITSFCMTRLTGRAPY